MREKLLYAIGVVEKPVDLNIDTLEIVKLKNGNRFKIEYTVADKDTVFGFKEERVRAYLFIPHHETGEKLPAMVAIHQWGMEKREWGKMETAGIKGDSTMFYGLELFNRGYAVICPDNKFFGERAYKLSERGKIFKSWDDDICDTNATKENDFIYEFFAMYPPMILKGHTPTAYTNSELSIAVDILVNLPEVNNDMIGAIGHSGGGSAIVPFMFADTRIKASVSSCGFTNIEKIYYKESDQFGDFGSPIFGLLNFGQSADLIAEIAPRAILFTKGKNEFGQGERSDRHVKDLTDMIDYAKKNFSRLGVEDKLKVIIFDENHGWHSFPAGVKSETYAWLDLQLKTP